MLHRPFLDHSQYAKSVLRSVQTRRPIKFSDSKFVMAAESGLAAKSAKDVIAELNLKPHPEKGYFIETFRDSATDSSGRAHSTQIYYLLEGESGLSHWHRVIDAVEVWHYYAGAPLQLSLSWDDGKPVRNLVLGTDFSAVRGSSHCCA
jgi:predicted cupin superfamily sugar epimerase